MEEKNEKIIKLICVYARTSTSNQEDQKTVQAQLSEVYAYAKKHNYDIVKEYIDEGWSGDILARPQLDQLRHDARSNAWEAVLVYDPDRLGRQLLYQQIVIDDLKKLQIDVLFVTMPPVTNASDKLLFGVRGLFAEYEKAKITERFRIGKVNRVKNNHVLTSEAPYGYKYILNFGKRGQADYLAGHFVINETEAKVVADIFKMADEDGLSIRGIVSELHKRGIKPRKSKRGVWSTSTLSTLLRNETYTGTAYWGASYATIPLNPKNKKRYNKVEKTSRRLRPKKDWYAITEIPIIINKELFDRVGLKLRKNFELMGRYRKNNYLLAGFIYCSCGHRRAGEGPHEGKFLYYRCTDRVYSHPEPPNCREKGINAKIADEAIWQRVKRIMSSPKLLLEQIDRWNRRQVEKSSNPQIDIENIRKEILKEQKQEDRLAIMYSKEIITEEKFMVYVEPIRNRIKEYETQILKANLENTHRNDILIPSKDDVKAFARKALKSLENLSFAAKQLIIRQTINKVIAVPGLLEVYGSINLNQNYYVKQQIVSRNCGAAKRREKHLI